MLDAKQGPSSEDSTDPSATIEGGVVTRRHFIGAVGFVALSLTSNADVSHDSAAMYGLIGQIRVVPGRRDELAEILVEGVSGMPGCLSYIVAKDSGDPDALWVTEVWDSPESHAASLSLPAVQAAIRVGRPLIAGFEEQTETEPVGGHGLV